MLQCITLFLYPVKETKKKKKGGQKPGESSIIKT